SNERNPSLFLLKFAPKEVPAPVSSIQVPSLEEAVKIALENRPEMRSAILDLKNKDIDVAYTANQKMPTLDVVATFNHNAVGGSQCAAASRVEPGSHRDRAGCAGFGTTEADSGKDEV